MAAALVTAAVLSALGLVAGLVFGYRAESDAEVLRHTTLALFATLLTLLTHSMMMFYLIGKGRAVREAVTEGRLSGEYVRRISEIRRPVFSLGTLAMLLVMITATVGGGVDTRVVPAGIHGVLAVVAVVVNLAAIRAEVAALAASTRLVDDVNRRLEA